MINQDNSFTIAQKVNKDNLEIMFNWFKDNHLEYRFNYVNNTICKLWSLYNEPIKNSKCILKPPAQNKTYPDLIERYVHIDAYDPVSYKREVRKILMAGTPTYEIDFHAESVYIYAKYITHDDLLLDTYINNDDFYKIIPNMPRDKQKKLVQIWLQGQYNDNIIYNEMFPVTAEYLKSSSNDYKRNSGLFRDIETRKLLEMLQMCKSRCVNHLHDAIYVNGKGLNTALDVINKVYDKGIKFEIKNMQKVCLTDGDICNTLNSIDWDKSAKEHDNNPYKSIITYDGYTEFKQYRDRCYLDRDEYKMPRAHLPGCDDMFDDKHEVNNAICAYMICNYMYEPRCR